jgi:hypothetical protein
MRTSPPRIGIGIGIGIGIEFEFEWASARSGSRTKNLRTSTYSGFAANTLEWYSCVAAAAHPGTETALNAPAAPLFAE